MLAACTVAGFAWSNDAVSFAKMHAGRLTAA